MIATHNSTHRRSLNGSRIWTTMRMMLGRRNVLLFVDNNKNYILLRLHFPPEKAFEPMLSRSMLKIMEDSLEWVTISQSLSSP